MNNPCRKCEFCFIYKNRHYPNNSACLCCDKRKKYEKYKLDRRMFVEGDVINTIDELLEQEWVMWHGITKHIEVIKHLPLSNIIGLIEGGYLRKAVRKEDI